ncbi:unnamed protein product, partial [marine sediment metagenome]
AECLNQSISFFYAPAIHAAPKWPLPDPAKAMGSEDEIMAEFRDTRDEIRRRVNSMLILLCEGVNP